MVGNSKIARPGARTEGPSSTARNRPPTGRVNQTYKQRGWKQQKQSKQPALPVIRAPRPPIRPDELGYEHTKKGRQQQLFQQLIQQYGPNFADTDVRLYLKKRHLNAAKGKCSRRGGFPLDDAMDKPDTFRKLSPEFQRTILHERSAALAAALPQLPFKSAWQLYTEAPSLLTLLTLEVAHKLRAMARATGLSAADVAAQLCSFWPLAFLHPSSAEGRLGLLAQVARLNRQQTVQLLVQHPQLWLMNSRLLATRCEELALMLSCCSATALELLATCPPLLTAQVPHMQQQLQKLCIFMGCNGRPAEVVTLLLLQPRLLLLPHAAHQQKVMSSSGCRCSNLGYLINSADQQQVVVDLQTAGMQSPEQVHQHLQCLCQQLQLPLRLVQLMVRRTPGLLSLCSSNSSRDVTDKDGRAEDVDSREGGSTTTGPAADVAAQVLSTWLCSSSAAARRDQYQRRLLQLLDSKSAKDRKRTQRQARSNPKPQEQQQWLPLGVGRYAAHNALAYLTAACQWWVHRPLLQQQLQLPSLQQVLVQAPALLMLAATSPAVQAHNRQSAAITTHPAAAGESGGILAAADRLEARHHTLYQVLRNSSHAAGQQQQKRQSRQITTHISMQQRQPQVDSVGDDGLLLQIRAAAVLEPNLMAQPPSLVASQAAQLSRVLLLSPKQLLDAAQHCPAVLWLTRQQVFEQVRVLCGILQLPAHQVRQKLLDPAVLPLLLLGADELRDNSYALLEAGASCGCPQEHVLQLVRDMPQLLLPGTLHLAIDLLSTGCAAQLLLATGDDT